MTYPDSVKTGDSTMKFIRKFSNILLILALGGASNASAEDVDIFLKNENTIAARPNVLLVLDNAASNNSNITLLDGVTSGKKLEMLRQVLNNIIDPINSPFFPACNGSEPRIPTGCVTREEVSNLLKNINLGLMIANPSGSDKGGYVRYHVRRMDVDANRTALVAKLNPDIPEANNAPYAKSMHEAYLYYGGKTAYVGFDSNQYDTAAKSGTKYASPANDACQDNYILFVGNGGPDSGEENDTKTLLNSLGGILTTDPVSFTPSNLTSSWFDEYARTLKKQDVVPHIDGIQNVTTYTIAVQNPADNNYNTNTMKSSRELLKSAAALGGGEYFEASNGQAVMKAFIDLLGKFQAVDSVFAASTLPVSVNVRGSFLNQVYMGQFRPDPDAGPRWPGNLKQYQIAVDAAGKPILADRFGQGVEDTVNGFILADKTSFWTTNSNYWAFDPLGNPKSASDAPDGNIVEKGGAAQRLRQDFATSAKQTDRKLYTCTSCATGTALSTNLFADSNTAITAGLLGAADATERTKLINWVRGADNIDDENDNGDSTDIRARIHGDLLHSRPAVVNYNRNGDDNDIMVYYGTNGGVFHAVKGGQADTDGGEKWGMVFPEFFSKLKRLRDNSPDISTTATKPYFADGSVSVYQKDANDDGKLVAADGDKVYLYVGMRRGGRFAYALDVSNPDAPKYLWKIDNSTDGFEELGQTWSTLRPARIRAETADPVVIFGAGYDPENEDSLPATVNDKGRGIFVVNGRTGALIKHILPAGMASIPADLAVLDRNNDGFFDRIYAADTKGNIWRVDIDDADTTKWTSYKLASLGGIGANARKFLNKPDVVFGADYDAVLVGSGDREHPFENTVDNRFYMLKDTKVGLTGGYVCETPAAGEDPAVSRPCVESDLVDVTSNPYQDTTASIKNGWYLTLEDGEKVVGNAITVFGTTFFGTNRPTPPAPGVCSSNLGEARMYAVGYAAGTATFDANADGVIDIADRFEVVPGGGFPPSPVYARTEVDGKPIDVVCTGSHCISPGGVTTTTNRFRTYWYIDTEAAP
jgi:type IV pilus assembly protein PilY1